MLQLLPTHHTTSLLFVAQSSTTNVPLPLVIAWLIFNLICLSFFLWINKSKKKSSFDNLLEPNSDEPPPPQNSPPPQSTEVSANSQNFSSPISASLPETPTQPITETPAQVAESSKPLPSSQAPEKFSLLQTQEGPTLLEEIKNLKSLIANLNVSAARKRKPIPKDSSEDSEEDSDEIIVSASEILQALTEAVFAVDRYGTILHMNRAASKLFGYQPEEIVGETLDPLIWVDVNPNAIRRPVLAEDPTFGLEQDGYGIRKDNSRFPAVVTVSIVRMKPLILAVTVRDTSPRSNQLSQKTSDTTSEEPSKSISYVPPVPLAQNQPKRPLRRSRKKIIHPG
ncbi:MAG: PAS domain-containing protein [Chthoniobacterales bacterium]|nr:PAS domain-containing protein [Chthoniobacterales bacterium]